MWGINIFWIDYIFEGPNIAWRPDIFREKQYFLGHIFFWIHNYFGGKYAFDTWIIGLKEGREEDLDERLEANLGDLLSLFLFQLAIIQNLI